MHSASIAWFTIRITNIGDRIGGKTIGCSMGLFPKAAVPFSSYQFVLSFHQILS